MSRKQRIMLALTDGHVLTFWVTRCSMERWIQKGEPAMAEPLHAAEVSALMVAQTPFLK
jgi:hypothetical protein